MHFLFKCEKLKDIRMNLFHKIPQILNHVENISKWIKLDNRPFIMIKYVTDLWNKRKNLLECVK